MIRTRRIIAGIFLIFIPVAAQTPSGDSLEETLRRVSKVIQAYSRDTMEIPFEVSSTIRRYDVHGKLLREQQTQHRVEQVKRRREGDFRQAWLQAHKRGLHRLYDEELNADLFTSFGILFDGDPSHAYRYDIVRHAASNRITVVASPDHECHLLEGKILLKHFCGVMRLEIDEATLMPLLAVFDAQQLPETAGERVMTSFHAEEEFQTVATPGSRTPLLVPAKVKLTYETDRGKSEIESHYIPKPK